MNSINFVIGNQGEISGKCVVCGRSFKASHSSGIFHLDVNKQITPTHKGAEITWRHAQYSAKEGEGKYEFSSLPGEPFGMVKFDFCLTGEHGVRITLDRNVGDYSIRLYEKEIVDYFRSFVKEMYQHRK